MENKRLPTLAIVAAGLVVAIAWRINTVTLMAIAGLCVGLIIGVPLGALGMYLIQRAKQQERERRGWARGFHPGQPPVVIVPPVSAPQLPQAIGWPGLEDAAHMPPARQFTVIGDVENEG